MADNFGLKIGIEGEKEFKNSLAEINRSFKVLGSEMKLVDSQFDKNDKSVEALSARNEVLDKSIEAQKNKINVLRSALENSSKSFGENDKRTQSWKVQLNNAQAELNKLEKELKDNNDALNQSDKEMADATKSADKMGDEIEDAGKKSDDAGNKFEKLGSVCKGVSAAIVATFAAVSAAAISAGKALIDATKEGAAFADGVLTQSTVTGISTEKLQEYMYAAELVDVSVETLTGSMKKNITAMKNAVNGSETYAEAYAQLGVAVTDSEGNLRDSEEVYWEIIEALGKIENQTERDALAMTLLGKSATDLNPLIEAGAEKMEELANKAHDAGYVLSDEMLQAYGAFDDQLQYLDTGMTALKNSLGVILLPLLTELSAEGVSLLGEFTKGINDCNGDISKMSGVISEILPKFINLIMEYIPQIVDLAMSIVSAVGNGIIDNLDTLLSAASEIVLTIMDGVTSALPKMAKSGIKIATTLVKGIMQSTLKLTEAAIEVINALADGITEAIPELLPVMVEVIVEIVKVLADSIPLIVDAALKLIEGLADGLIKAIPILVNALPKIITSIINALLSAIPMIINAGIKLLSSLVSALPTIINSIVDAVVEIINSIVKVITENIPMIIEAGINLLTSLIAELPTIIQAIVNAIPQIITSLVSCITENLDLIIDAGIMLFTSLISSLPEILEVLVGAIVQIIDGLIVAITENLPQIIEAGIQLFMSLIGALPEIIDALVTSIPTIVTSLVSAIVENIPLIIDAGIKLFTALITNLPQIIAEIVKAIPQILTSIVNGFAGGFGQMQGIGKNLVEGLWEGIKGLTSWVKDKVSGWASDLLGGIKDFFGIHSPSRKMAWVGDMLMQGLAGGIDDSAKLAIDSANDMTKDLNKTFDNLSQEGTYDLNANLNTDGIRSTVLDSLSDVYVSLKNNMFDGLGSINKQAEAVQKIEVSVPIYLDGEEITNVTSKIQSGRNLTYRRAMGV